jgi:hypothetical protein
MAAMDCQLQRPDVTPQACGTSILACLAAMAKLLLLRPLIYGERVETRQTRAETAECYRSISVRIPGRSSMTIESRRDLSGHSGWLSDHVIEVPPPDGPYFEESAFFECCHRRTIAGGR